MSAAMFRSCGGPPEADAGCDHRRSQATRLPLQEDCAGYKYTRNDSGSSDEFHTSALVQGCVTKPARLIQSPSKCLDSVPLLMGKKQFPSAQQTTHNR